VIMRRWLPYVVAALLGTGAAVLAACSDAPESGIAAGEASSLKSQIEDIQQRVDDARCQALFDQLRQVDTRVDRLPSSVDAQLRQRLRDGSDNLRETARRECERNREAKETKTATTETLTNPEPIETQPPPTTTNPRPTTTTPPPTTTSSPPPPPEPVPQPSPPGGGTPPELGP